MLIVQVLGWVLPLQAIGLAIDVIGTLCIAAPDVPYLNKWFLGGRLRDARAKLETTVLSKEMAGYDDIIEAIEEFPEVEIESRPEVITVERNIGSREHSGAIYGHYQREGEEMMEGKKLTPVTFGAFRLLLREKIRESESRIRMAGFITLAFGFMVQIVGVL